LSLRCHSGRFLAGIQWIQLVTAAPRPDCGQGVAIFTSGKVRSMGRLATPIALEINHAERY
jgi:hypothetical protein